MQRLYILDGYGYIFRAYYGIATARGGKGAGLSTASGMPTGALYVYAQMLYRLHENYDPKRIVVAFDHSGDTFRNELYADYKANRSAPPEDLTLQLPHFRRLTEAFSWPVVSVQGYEADDVIATIAKDARQAGLGVTIFSADKDLMALVDEDIEMIDSMRGKTYDEAAVLKKFGVKPALVPDYLALVGDTSDNIPGMPGVGKVTAAKMLNTYHSIDGLLEARGELKGKMKERFADEALITQLKLSQSLVALCDSVPLPMELGEMTPGEIRSDTLSAVLDELEFRGLKERIMGETQPAETGSAGDAEANTRAHASKSRAYDPALIVTSEVQVAAFAKAAVDKGALSLFVVTDGSRHDRTRIVGLALWTESSAPIYVPIAHHYLGMPEMCGASALQSIRELLGDASVQVVCHDARSTLRALHAHDLDIENVHADSLLTSYLLDASINYQDPATLAKPLGLALPTQTEFFGKGKKKVEPEHMGVPEMAEYAASIAQTVQWCIEDRQGELKDVGMEDLYHQVEMPLCRLLAKIEARGILLDCAFLETLSVDVSRRIAQLEEQVFELAGESLNIASPKQLSVLLFDKLGLRSERMKKTKTGYSTDHEVLEAMIDVHDIVRPILKHRELTKLKGTYVDALPPLVNPKTGRLHTLFNNALTTTGRLSSLEPNLQNIPIRSDVGRTIRQAFVSAPGKMLVSADYSQIELRVVAHLSKDPVLMSAFERGIDVHTQTAAEVFGMELADVGSAERRVAKAVNYGLIYGQSEFGLARALDIPRFEARKYISNYFSRFDSIRTFMDRCVEDAKREGFTTTVLGRRRPIPEIQSKNQRIRAAAERTAQNTPVQGSAADIMKLAMLKADEAAKEYPTSTMLLTVHDELIFEVDDSAAPEFAAKLKTIMEEAYRLDVPLVVDVGMGRHWSDAH